MHEGTKARTSDFVACTICIQWTLDGSNSLLGYTSDDNIYHFHDNKQVNCLDINKEASLICGF